MNTQSISDDNDDDLIDIRSLFEFLLKWWLPILLVSTTIMVLTTLIVFRITPTYKAVSILEVKQQERQIIEVAGIESIDADDEFLATQIELFNSQSLIREVIENTNLLSDDKFIDFSDPELLSLSRAEKNALSCGHVF